MKAEGQDTVSLVLTPTVRSTAKTLYGIYIFMTIVEIIFLLAGGMPLFDALTTTFGTAGTGGFGIKNDSLSASYSTYIQVVVTVFMILFGINFNIYFLILAKKWKQALKSEELKWYLITIGAAMFLIAWDIRMLYGSFGEALQQSAFQVASIITTTGFATTDFNVWPEVSRTVLIMLMFVGACAGSTGGGIKVSRFVILLKSMGKEIKQYLHPRQVRKIQLDGKPVEHEVVRNVNVFMVVYTMIFGFSMLILAFDGNDLISNFTAVAATFNNIGPGLELVGPSANFDLCASTSREERQRLLALLASGDLCVLFGTHALLESDVVCKSCTLVVIDEEQRLRRRAARRASRERARESRLPLAHGNAYSSLSRFGALRGHGAFLRASETGRCGRHDKRRGVQTARRCLRCGS